MLYQWPSPGKLNLFLYVTGHRHTDNYHFLQTFFQFIEYGDTIKIFTTNTGQIRLFIQKKEIIQCSDNLIVRAARLLRHYRWPDQKMLGADIFLHKTLPIGSGLGGASSNAATVLIALNYQWRCYLSSKILMRLGIMLGADVPIFIHGMSSFAEGIGATFTSIFLPEKWYLIVIPTININTALIFKMYRLYRYYSLYRPIKELLMMPFYNDCEYIVRKIFPEINIYFKYLSQFALATLTGTGSCIFSAFNNEHLAYRVQSCLPSWINSIVTKGVNISPLHNKLLKNSIIMY